MAASAKSLAQANVAAAQTNFDTAQARFAPLLAIERARCELGRSVSDLVEQQIAPALARTQSYINDLAWTSAPGLEHDRQTAVLIKDIYKLLTLAGTGGVDRIRSAVGALATSVEALDPNLRKEFGLRSLEPEAFAGKGKWIENRTLHNLKEGLAVAAAQFADPHYEQESFYTAAAELTRVLRECVGELDQWVHEELGEAMHKPLVSTQANAGFARFGLERAQKELEALLKAEQRGPEGQTAEAG